MSVQGHNWAYHSVHEDAPHGQVNRAVESVCEGLGGAMGGGTLKAVYDKSRREMVTFLPCEEGRGYHDRGRIAA